jgi:hypothetical protein
MKFFVFLIGFFVLCGCVHVETPHHVGDRLELLYDVYLIQSADRSLPDITVNIKTKSKWAWPNFPVEVSEANIGKTYLEKKIVGILRAGNVLEIKRMDLVNGGGHIYKYVFLKNTQTGAVYDLTDNKLIDVYETADGFRFILSPLVFSPSL